MKKYVEFKSEDIASSWGHKLYDSWADCYKKVINAVGEYEQDLQYGNPIEEYLGYGYIPINQYLRNKANNLDELTAKAASNMLTHMLYAPRIDQDIIVYRNISEKRYRHMLSNIDDERGKGEPYYERGFMSTSLIRSYCEEHGDYILKIYVQRGTPAIFGDALTERGEYELVLCPNIYLKKLSDDQVVGDKHMLEVRAELPNTSVFKEVWRNEI